MRRAILILILVFILASAFGVFAACQAVMTVQFDTSGGSPVQRQLLAGGSFAIRPDDPDREGYTFENWYADEECAYLFDFEKTKITKNTVIYAGWTIGEFTIDFVTIGTAVPALTLKFGEPLELSESYLTGYRFTGWHIDAACTKKFESLAMPGQNLILYAAWQSDPGYSAFKFVENERGYTLVSVKDIKLNILPLPDTFNNLPVNRVGKFAFEDAKRVSEIHLPDSIEFVEESAFEGCSALTRVVIPVLEVLSPRLFYGCAALESVGFAYGLKSVGAAAFYGCSSLEDVLLPEGLESIGDRAFYGCAALTEIVLPGSLIYIGDRAFSGSKLTSVTLPDSLLQLNADVFYNCDRLEAVILGNKIESIGSGAFENCIMLSSLDLPSGIARLESRAFASTGLSSLTLPDRLSEIGDYLLFNCAALTEVEISGILCIGNYMFSNCRLLTKVNLSQNLLSIGDGAFENCASLKNLALPAALQSIGISAFRGCAVGELALPQGISEVPESAFEDCLFLSRVVLPAGLLKISDYAFSGCLSLSDIILPALVAAIGYRAFSGCGLIDNFYFGEDLREVGGYAFDGTGWLNNQGGDVYAGRVFYRFGGGPSVTFKAGTVAIAGYAFLGNNRLASVVIPQSVETIGDSAFRNCTALVSVSLAALKVGEGVFSGCISLASVELKEGLVAISDDMFYQCVSLAEIAVPPSAKEIGARAFYGCDRLMDVDFVAASSVVIVKTSAFELCAALSEIELPDSVAEIMSFAFLGTALRKLAVGTGIRIIREQAAVSARMVESMNGSGSVEEHGVLTVLMRGTPSVRLSSFAIGPWLKIILPDSFYSLIKSGGLSAGYEGWSVYSPYIYKNSTVRGDWVIENGRLTAYLGSAAAVTIPDDATEIEPYTFSGMGFVSSVKFNPALKTIGERAFYATSIINLEIGDGVTSIGAKAFWVSGYLYRINISVRPSITHTPATLGTNALKIRGYHSAEADGDTFYRFEGDDAVYGANGKLAVYKAGQEAAATAAFVGLSGTAFERRIIFISRADLLPQYRTVWAAYGEFLTAG
ncbi:MAG: leucine-rich repeat protein [Firmicutes bacterium]|nr:leucine-rich repeat protein [Bacillota bacterium]